MCLGVQWGQRVGGEQAAPADGVQAPPVFPALSGGNGQFRRSPLPTGTPCVLLPGPVLGAVHSLSLHSQCCWGLFAPCECQQDQMFASGERAGRGYMDPHLQPPDVPAAPQCDESFGLAVVIWGELVPLTVPPQPGPPACPTEHPMASGSEAGHRRPLQCNLMG